MNPHSGSAGWPVAVRWALPAFAALVVMAMPLLATAAAAANAPTEPPQEVLAPAGPQAQHILALWRVTLGVCSVVFAAILAALLLILWRRAARGPGASSRGVVAVPARNERLAGRSVAGAVLASTLLLLFLIVASVLTDRVLAGLSLKNALHIEVTASQWWWSARYDDPEASRMFTVANELHVPVGRPLLLTLKSNDVIHSFWVPNLHGKKDLIPGRTATLQLQADRPGLYRGQCAEFCGLQHAFMALRVVADEPERYETWAARQRQPAAEPSGVQAQRGRDLFLGTSCVMCHAISGTDASARRAPDLTHLASRQTLAAGTLANNADNLAAWIRNPQQFKPGSNMPASNLPDDDLRALVAYLQSLS